MFDAKIYKNVDGIFNVSSCGEWNKKILKIPIFVSSYHRSWSKIARKQGSSSPSPGTCGKARPQ
jgi:hypothetical protein